MDAGGQLDGGVVVPNGCTLWPDTIFGKSIKDCCDAHDLSDLGVGSSVDLMYCVADKGGPEFLGVGIMMAVATALFARMVRRIGNYFKSWKG